MPGTLDLEFPAAAEALSSMRRTVRSWLGAFGVDDETVAEVALVCTEVCSNAIEHADATQPIHLDGNVRDGLLRLEVRDRGQWDHEGPLRDRGNGLRLVRALMDEVAIRRHDDGTEIVMYRWLENGVRLAASAS